MSLIDDMMEDCSIMNKQKIADGEGGTYTTWVEGASISVAIVQDQSMRARIALKDGVNSIYTLTTKTNVKLDFNDVIKRKKDGRIFRVTSEPKISEAMNMSQVTAEKWELTND